MIDTQSRAGGWAKHIEKMSSTSGMVRGIDPLPSVLAAQRFIRKGKRVTHSKTILIVLCEAEAPLTTSGIAQRCNLTEQQTHKRMGDLTKYAEIAGMVKCPIKGTMCQAWRIKRNTN